MASHYFDTELARRYSIEEAILVEQLYWWIRRNDVNAEMEKEGRVWCYMTADGMSKYFSYMNSQKVRRILLKLHKRGKIHIGNFNKVATNQTLWYAFSDEFMKELKELNYDFSKVKNGTFKDEKSKEVIYNEVNYTHIDNLSDTNVSSKQQYDSDTLFLEFWEKYKKNADKKRAFIAFKRLSKADKLAAIAGIEPYRNARGQNNQYIKNAATYIHNRTWEDDFSGYSQKIAFYDAFPQDTDEVKRFKAWMRLTYPEIENTALPLSYDDYIKLVGENYQNVEKVSNALTDIVAEVWKYRKSDIASVVKQKLLDNEQRD